MSANDPPPGFVWATMVPELLVSDLGTSLHFWRDLCGFVVAYERAEDRFAYLDRSGRQVMLEEVMVSGRRWVTGSLERPFGRGINFQITVDDVMPILASLHRACWPLFLEAEDVWYQAGSRETGGRQFLVQDPDGYLVRFSQGLGLRPVPDLR